MSSHVDPNPSRRRHGARRPGARPLGALGVAALVVVLAGCTAEPEQEAAAPERALNVVQPGAPGEDSVVLDPTVVPSVVAVPHTEADVAFMQDMIGHHAQAIVMTSLVEDRSEDEQLKLFVERMDISQVDEITQMQNWLTERGEDAPEWDPVFGDQGGHSDMDMGMGTDDASMPGMATPEELDRLEAASGEEFDRLFLQMMTRHHQGALTMVEELFEAGGGEETTIYALTTHIVGDQGIEMDRMAGMLAELDA